MVLKLEGRRARQRCGDMLCVIFPVSGNVNFAAVFELFDQGIYKPGLDQTAFVMLLFMPGFGIFFYRILYVDMQNTLQKGEF